MTTPVLWIVDDDEDDRFLLERAIRQLHLNYRLIFFEDGNALLTQVTTRERPQLIIMDYNLPPMNARELTQRLRTVAGFEEVPIEWMSSQIDPIWQQQGSQLGVYTYWPKPSTYPAWETFAQQLSRLQ